MKQNKKKVPLTGVVVTDMCDELHSLGISKQEN